eukprot:11223810-Ditylum_brightwellii.AAC.1
MRYLPFHQHHKSHTLQLNVPRLSETFATDTLFSSEVGLGGITCVQLYVGTQSKLTKVFGMRTESEGPQAFDDFIRDNGAPYTLRSNNAKMQIGISFKNILRKYNICSKHTKPDHPTQNFAERCIQYSKRTSANILDRTGAPDYTWFFCMLHTVMLLNNIALESIGWITLHQACFGTTPDISALLHYCFYQPIYYLDKEAFPITSERRGHWLEVAENKGNTLTYWILADNKQVLACSLICPLTYQGQNQQVPQPQEILDRDVAKVEGSQVSSQASNLQLDLLSDLVNSPTPTVDSTNINCFNPNDHIGMEFIHMDKKGIPTKVTIMEVNEETGK